MYTIYSIYVPRYFQIISTIAVSKRVVHTITHPGRGSVVPTKERAPEEPKGAQNGVEGPQSYLWPQEEECRDSKKCQGGKPTQEPGPETPSHPPPTRARERGEGEWRAIPAPARAPQYLLRSELRKSAKKRTIPKKGRGVYW